ncbi:tat pathway signal sequence domain-containing protein [Penicillium malachiteum]|uniref:Tat pathway signal sequence domain-containing protein n=1 Tax=Penicillium malachiteum TaxID=1324776 RepID=A0AAD6HSJ9_9EURO|nr:tat pathway signal sequence domain-containing protein [Penicillium malachiteum]
MWLLKTWLLGTLASATLVSGASYPKQQGHAGKKRNVNAHLGTFLHNRISPNYSELYIAEADGSNEKLLLGSNTVYDFRASWSPDASYVHFTSERRGDGQADVYRVAIDGTSTAGATVESIALSPGVDDSSSISPDGKTLADGSGWEHTQELFYAVCPKGSDFRHVSSRSNYTQGSPKFSPDGKRVVFYEMLTEDTYNARLEPELLEGAYLNTSIVSIDFATGDDRIVHAIGDGTKISPSFVTNDVIGYDMKESASNGIYYASISGKNYTQYQTIPMNTMIPAIRSPAWSPDGKYVIFEKQGPTGGSTSTSKTQYSELWSFDPDWNYRFTDVFPAGPRSGCPLIAMFQQMEGPADTNLMRLSMNGTDQVTLFEPSEDMINPSIAEGYNARAYQANWGPNDTNITFGFGAYFVARSTNPGFIYSINADGSDLTLLAGNNITNYGFPSFNHDGSKVVFRTWPGTADNGTTVGSIGLALYDVNTHTLTQLTTEWDNLPSFSPDGKKVLFTRRTNWNNIGGNYDIFTMDLDGNDLVQVTQSVASDAHAGWTGDGRILYSTAMFGFQQEAPLYDDSMQPYAIIMVMDGDGNNKTLLTYSLWEDAMPMYVPAHILASTCYH